MLSRGDDPPEPPGIADSEEHGFAAPRLVSQCPANYRHLVDSTTPAMMNANPTTRFQSARAPIGKLPWVT